MLAVVIVLAFIPSAALAEDDNLDGYNDNDFDKLQAFLDLPSAAAGQTNGQVLNPAYDDADPATWTGVTWNADAEKRVINIAWSSFVSLAGALDVSGFTALLTFACNENQLTSLDVSGCTALTGLYCNENQLTSLDVSGCAALGALECYQNELASLDVSSCAMLVSLYCNENQLTSLDVSGCTSLGILYCYGNQLVLLDVSDLTLLQILYCFENRLTSLDVSGCTILYLIFCGSNMLSSLDVSDSMLMYIDTMNNPVSGDKIGNPLTHLHFTIGSNDYTLNSADGGYVNTDMVAAAFIATPLAPSTFINWTDADGNEVSAAAEFMPAGSGVYTANFTPALELSPAGGNIYTDGRITITPNYEGGTWDYPEDLLSAEASGSGMQFTGRAAGTARVTYTVESQSEYVDIVITASDLPSTGQDFILIASLLALAVCAAAAALTLLIVKSKCRAHASK
jgi:hypothetical protein